MPPLLEFFPDYWTALRDLVNGQRLDSEMALAHDRQCKLQSQLDFSTPLRILDLANGRLRPQYLLLQDQGHCVTGVDLINQPGSEAYGLIYRLARWLYARRLPGAKGAARVDRLACADVGRLPFASDSFDLVTSVAAFEHFLDVPAVVGEVERVLRPGGTAYIYIHPFTAASGGHNVKLMEVPLRSLPAGIDAWDHLRRRHVPFHVPLNEWRIAQYVDLFSQHFEILHSCCAMREGEHLLTPEVLADLPAYSPDELTCGSYAIVALKR